MTIRARLVVGFVLLVAAAFSALLHSVLGELRPRYLESMEAALAETAALVASLVENGVDVAAAVERAKSRKLGATIFDVKKDELELRILVTDGSGIVTYDSDGTDTGQDYSRWNDVLRTLRGEYGARSTRADPADPGSSVKYVSAPVRGGDRGDRILGVVSVGKPSKSVTAFLESARRKVALTALLVALAAIFAGAGLSLWITRPIQRLTAYARAVRDGLRVPPPDLGRGEMADLGRAFEEMREALEGKKYVEKYTQTLTHELKSPLSAIRGAAELLAENPPEPDRGRFLANIRAEGERITSLVERLLLLSSLESSRALAAAAEVDLKALLEEVAESFRPQMAAKDLTLHLHLEEIRLRGDAFLLRQAASNLLQNAVEFTPDGGAIRLGLRAGDESAEISVEDTGPGVPDYARDKIFDRFYSLPRPGTGKRSSGLGLNLVREVAVLHGGTAALDNRREGGARATLRLPL